MNTARCILLGFLGLWLTGCATPEYRIKKNQDLFNTFAPEQQAAIREGKVLVGFDSDMARIALGEPDRIYTRTTESGTKEVWAYVRRITRSRLEPVRSSFRYRDSKGRVRHAYDTDYVRVENYVEYDQLRLEFVEGRIVAIEEVTQ